MVNEEKITILEMENQALIEENKALKKRLDERVVSIDEIDDIKNKLLLEIESINKQRKELKKYTKKYKDLCIEIQRIKNNYDKAIQKILKNIENSLN